MHGFASIGDGNWVSFAAASVGRQDSAQAAADPVLPVYTMF